jgi:anti-sigma regulatory factor (Ser/Thr protein kinase)
VIVTSLRPVGRKWRTLSFASTLYLKPVLELLLAEVPPIWQAELHLGLQEALVNAAKHGNHLDPAKQVIVQFSIVNQEYWWVVSDQGDNYNCCIMTEAEFSEVPCSESECGRGFYILQQIFDRVQWNDSTHELHLCKHINRYGTPAIY